MDGDPSGWHTDWCTCCWDVYCRVKQAEEEATAVVDVDGSYLYHKYQRLVESGKDVTQPDHPRSPPSGWKVVNERTYKDIAPSIPLVTTGTIFK